MGLLRPGTKITFWNPGFRNKPGVRPPGLLAFLSIVALLSAIAVPVYAVTTSLASINAPGLYAYDAIYIAVLHFLLPLGVAYTVSTNSPLSRGLIAIYSAILYVATLAGKGYLGRLDIGETTMAVAATAVFVAVQGWLFFSPRMRIYYALLADRPVPQGLESRVPELSGGFWLGEKSHAVFEWLADNLETVVLVGFILIAVIALVQTSV